MSHLSVLLLVIHFNLVVIYKITALEYVLNFATRKRKLKDKGQEPSIQVDVTWYFLLFEPYKYPLNWHWTVSNPSESKPIDRFRVWRFLTMEQVWVSGTYMYVCISLVTGHFRMWTEDAGWSWTEANIVYTIFCKRKVNVIKMACQVHGGLVLFVVSVPQKVCVQSSIISFYTLSQAYQNLFISQVRTFIWGTKD